MTQGEKLAIFGMDLLSQIKETQSEAGVDTSCVILLAEPSDPLESFSLVVGPEETPNEHLLNFYYGQCLKALVIALVKLHPKHEVMNMISEAFAMSDGTRVANDDVFDDLDSHMQ